jgi:hypothetical protein
MYKYTPGRHTREGRQCPPCVTAASLSHTYILIHTAPQTASCVQPSTPHTGVPTMSCSSCWRCHGATYVSACAEGDTILPAAATRCAHVLGYSCLCDPCGTYPPPPTEPLLHQLPSPRLSPSPAQASQPALALHAAMPPGHSSQYDPEPAAASTILLLPSMHIGTGSWPVPSPANATTGAPTSIAMSQPCVSKNGPAHVLTHLLPPRLLLLVQGPHDPPAAFNRVHATDAMYGHVALPRPVCKQAAARVILVGWYPHGCRPWFKKGTTCGEGPRRGSGGAADGEVLPCQAFDPQEIPRASAALVIAGGTPTPPV